MKDLGTLGGPKADSWALGIDDTGRISGCSEVKGGRTHAFDYTDAEGMHDLGDVGNGGRVICYLNGHMGIAALKKGPPAAPRDGGHDSGANRQRQPAGGKEAGLGAQSVHPKPPDVSPRGAKESGPQTPGTREERRTSP